MPIRRLILVWLVPGATDGERVELAQSLGRELASCAREGADASHGEGPGAPETSSVEAGVKRDPRSGFDLFATATFAADVELMRFDSAANGIVARVVGSRLGGSKQYDFVTLGMDA